jgi:hypothetical protein
MRSVLFVLMFGCLCSAASAQQQYYFRGEVSDESGNLLQQVAIRQLSTGLLFKSGMAGRFGITSNALVDSFSFSLEGYQSEKWVGTAASFLQIRLKLLSPSLANPDRPRLSSRTNNMSRQEQRNAFVGNETYASLVENPWINTLQYPTTGFSLNVDRASESVCLCAPRCRAHRRDAQLFSTSHCSSKRYGSISRQFAVGSLPLELGSPVAASRGSSPSDQSGYTSCLASCFFD